MEKIVEIWRNNYFIQPILDIVLILTFVISVRKKSNIKELKLLPIYLGSFILLMFNTYFFHLFFINTSLSNFFSSLDRYGNFIVTLFEFITFSYYLYSINDSTLFKRIIKILFSLSISIFAIVLTKLILLDKYKGMNLLNRLYMIESISLLFMSILYLVHYFITDKFSTSKNIHLPIVKGLTLYLVLTLPITFFTTDFFMSDITLYKNIFAIIYLSYILLFIQIIKGYNSLN